MYYNSLTMIQDESKVNVEFYYPDPGWIEFPLSTKESFLVIADQALKVASSGMEIAITSEGEAHIALRMGEKIMPIVNISTGIFDRYWEFLSHALKSESGFRIKIKDRDVIYDIAGEAVEMEDGRKVIMRFSEPMRESDFIKLDDEKEKEN